MAAVDQITTAAQLLQSNLQHCKLIAGELAMMSPAGFDRGWLQAGCPLVWGVDPQPRTVSVYRSRSEIAVLQAEETLSDSNVLPGFSVPVAAIFA
jgi:Uma2 family endonuclease